MVAFADRGPDGGVLVALGTGPSGARGVQLLETAADGTDVRDIGPRVPGQQTPDSVFALNRDDIWFATSFDGGGSETLYRTEDGGRTWTGHPAPGHVGAAGSTDALWFVTAQRGWLAVIEPTGPSEDLYRTTDGGRRWDPEQQTNLPSRLPLTGTGQYRLPRLGPVQFNQAVSVGWLGGGGPWFTGSLDYTTDQGHSWRTVAIPTRPGDAVDPPAIFGRHVLVSDTRCGHRRTQLLTFAGHDSPADQNDRGRWALRSTLTAGPGCEQTSTGFSSPNDGWTATLAAGQVIVHRTVDGARHWTRVTIPRPGLSQAPTLVAVDADHAWLIGNLSRAGTIVYRTSNGGGTWQQLTVKP